MTNAENLRALREKAKAKGFCWVCRCRPAKSGRTTCQHCIDLQVEKKRRYISERRCVSCCKDLKRSERAQKCTLCTKKRSASFRLRKMSTGTCWHCRYPAAPGFSLCLPCKEKTRVKALARRPDTKKLYRCSVCGQSGHNSRSCGYRPSVSP